MANRRMISKSISISEQVNSMSEFAQLLFTWMIPHTDDWGILPGSAKVLKALVMPMSDRTEIDFDDAIQEINKNDLIWLYEVEGKRYIQFRKFEQHQEGLHKRTSCKFPTYSNYLKTLTELSGTSGKFPPNRIEEKGSEGNITETNITEISFAKIKRFYEDNIGLITRSIVDDINSFLDDGLEADLIIKSINEAVDHNKRSWAYSKKILVSCYEKNIKSLQQFEAAQLEYKQKNQGTQKSMTDDMEMIEQVRKEMVASGKLKDI
jgi:DnaD/phage-associated family protein